MKQFNNIPGYELIRSEELKDVKGTGLYYRHIKTGARICVIANDDDNKVFSIAFRTPPKDSTGVAHITEHSVLCGSRKFPAKDPFVELCKGSLNTFLNALTFSDKTMYPVASCNDKDFANLMDVYLDAVLNPNIYSRPQIFKQEGWHYELESEDAELKLNGVVYSEMKGSFSSPDSIFSETMKQNLFPNNEYGVCSGGDPDVIPELTSEQFLDFHRTFYHPTNSYIWLYGNMDVEERLTWMDREYLSKYEKISLDSSIRYQKEFGRVKEVESFYNVEEDNKDGKGVFYSYSVLAGDSKDVVTGIGYEVLDYCLFSAQGAPVRQALIDAGIGDDVIDYYDGSRLQPYFVIGVKNAKPGLKDKFIKVIRETLERVVKEGLDERSVKAALNSDEFRYKESDFGSYPKGLMYNISALSTLLYDDDKPFDTFYMNDAYAEVRKKIEKEGTKWFEQLIVDTFLDPKHGLIFTLLPKKGFNDEKNAALAKKLSDYKNSLSKEQLKALVEETKALKAYQSEPSTEEEINSIPLLSKDDIKKEARPYHNEKILPSVGDVVWHDYFTNGISYITYFFNVNCLKKDELPYLGLLCNLLGAVNTKQHTYKELDDEVNIHTGGFFSDISSYVKLHDSKVMNPYFLVGIKTLYSETDKALELLTEIMNESVFTDTKRLGELLLEEISSMEAHFVRNGHSIMRALADSYDNAAGLYEEKTGGISYYDFIKALASDFDSRKDEVIRKLGEVASKVFTRENITVGVTCDKEGVEKAKKALEKSVNTLPSRKQEKKLVLEPVIKNEGIKYAGQVQYVFRAGNFKDKGFRYNGHCEVLNSILRYGYLWNEVRVKGGAYGVFFGASDLTGFTYIGSYRDPQLRRTNEVIEGIVDYIRSFEADDREMTKAIIGTFGGVDAPLSPRALGNRSMNAYFTGRTVEDVQKIRDEALSTTAQDIRETLPLFEGLLDKGIFVTYGSFKAIDECKDMFKSIRTLG